MKTKMIPTLGKQLFKNELGKLSAQPVLNKLSNFSKNLGSIEQQWRENNRAGLHISAVSHLKRQNNNLKSITGTEFLKNVLTDIDCSIDSPTSDVIKSTEDIWFNMFKEENSDMINIGKFLAALQVTGLKKTDPRLSDFMDGLKEIHRKSAIEGSSPDTLQLGREEFKK
uniref:Glutaminase EF-hand domain-containing protein n=1 Tax=Clastoptera arizonana TaxID=38151 RepID=A0A1B6CXI9_9HEMI